MPEVAKKKRIFQIAKELNISHMEIIQFLKNNGTEARSHMDPVNPEAYDENNKIKDINLLRRMIKKYFYCNTEELDYNTISTQCFLY